MGKDNPPSGENQTVKAFNTKSTHDSHTAQSKLYFYLYVINMEILFFHKKNYVHLTSLE